MKRIKLYAILISLFVSTLFATAAFAEEPSEPTSTGWTETVLEALEKTNPNIVLGYTPDSVLGEGVSCELFVDGISKKFGFNIVEDLPMGYVIYDDKSTPHIEGVRVNGEAVTSLEYAIDANAIVSEYKVDVKIVYAEGVFGDLAQMSDGTYDWSKLLSNPIVVLQAVYYALAVLSVAAGILAAFFSRNKKAKTADEIAAKVDEAAKSSLEDIKKEVVDTVMAEATPVLQNILNDMQNVVKAIVIFTSKSKDAPIALLDTLQQTSDISVSKIIDEIRENVKHSVKAAEENHAANVATLHSIAQSTKEVTENVESGTTHKSVF